MSPVMKSKSGQNKPHEEINDSSSDLEAKDSFGIMHKLKIAITRKYEIIEMVGNGSYGTVMKAKNRQTD